MRLSRIAFLFCSIVGLAGLLIPANYGSKARKENDEKNGTCRIGFLHDQ